MPLLDVSPEGLVHQPFRTPDAYDSHPIRVVSIDDPKRRILQFPKLRRVELRHDSAAVRILLELLDASDHPGHQPLPDFRDELGCVPVESVLKIV